MRKKFLQPTVMALFAWSLVLAGCEDEEKNKALAEAEQARVSLTRVKAQLARAEREIVDLNDALEMIKQSRDELASQIRDLAEERGSAIAAVQEAQEGAMSLSIRSSEQNESAVTLQRQLGDMTSVIESQENTIAEHEATIAELLKTIELLQGPTEDMQDDGQGQKDANDLG